ncbi:SWIM zinc finger family protein [Catenuloplanes japonicus]|uniref:SWIM zinc finger family protein n=1 Tax=Catenuloplanes japonicus TaxID=33876 RepID=UPI00052516C3|nr:SWIM zinc finger family protein [Catenuloplanes japonicus]
MPVEPWTAAHVLALAPDASSAKGAQSVSGAAKWEAVGLNDDVLWGLCKGSGKKPYQACVDLSGPAYKCSCPSRKFPCKHALGLLLLWSAGSVPTGDPLPDWVAEWQAGRRDRAARAETRRAEPGVVVDEAAARKRADQRADRVAGGLAELDRWLLDQVTSGLAGAERAGYGPFETMAARLVDAQAGTAASTVRRLGRLAGVGAGWADRLLGELGLLRLLVAGYDRRDALPPELAATVRTRIGFATSTDEVLAGPRLRDSWQVLGQADTVEERLTSRRTWLRGVTTGRSALLLAYAAPGQSLPGDAVPGTLLDAELCFYPGASPLRALIAQPHGTSGLSTVAGALPVRAALAAAGRLRASDPWLEEVPVLLGAVRPAGTDRLTDPAGDAVWLVGGEPWWLLAASGGHPVTVAGELTTDGGVRPLAVWSEDGVFTAAPHGAVTGDRHATRLPGELVSSALVGVERRPWRGPSVTAEGRELLGPAEALLEAAAVAVVCQRSGPAPSPDVEPDAPAGAEPRPPVTPAAARRLAQLLSGAGVPGGGDVAQRLLAEWLRIAAAHGLRAPASSLPALLDAGRRSTALRPALALVAGARGGWLAERHPDWRYLLTEATATADEADWATGSPGARLAYLVALRERDPDAARELLTAGFDAEEPEQRARFVAALATGLSTDDEPLLERALDDRRREVRQAAAELLAALPGSALRARMTGRALDAVRLDAGRLVITPPAACDAAMRRDGIAPKPPRGVGERAWLLEEVVARTPLSTWTGAFGLDPAAITALPVADDWALTLHKGLSRAAVTERDPAWVMPLADLMSRPINRDLDVADHLLTMALYEALPPAELGRYAARVLRADPARAHRLAELCPAPWPDELADAALDGMASLSASGRYAWNLGDLCRLAAAAMPVSCTTRVAELAERIRHAGDAAVTTRPADTVAALAAALTYRHEMTEELR